MNNEKNKEKWIKKVHENLILRGRSEKTFINYRCALMKFLNYYGEDTNIKKLKEDDIIPFLNDEYIMPNKSKNTYNLCVSAIRLLYLVCFNKLLNRLLLPSCKLPKRLPKILFKSQFLEIFNNEENLKHRCWLILAFCSGLRVDEITRIKVEDINSKEHKLRVIGKGDKERYTILPDITIKFLRLYCKEQKIKSGYLFTGTNGKEIMNSKSIINFFTLTKKSYKLDDGITFHSLRHSFATYYLSNNGSLLTLQSMLGHSSLNSTTIYLHLSQNFNNLEGINYDTKNI